MAGSAFLSRRSTLIVIILRIALICVPHTLPFGEVFPQEWLYSSALKSILIRPHSTLSHVREARAIRDLSGGRFSDAYNPSQVTRVPPLLLAAIDPLLDFHYSQIFLSVLLLLVDILIAYMLESIGTHIVISAPDTEKEEEVKLPDAIKPPNAHIFPVSRQQSSPKSLIALDSIPLLSANLYFWSPFVAMPGSIFGCYQNLATLFLVASLFECCRPGGSKSVSTCFLAMAAYIEPYHIVFLVPLLLLFQRNAAATNQSSLIVPLLLFGIWSCCFQWLAYSLIGPGKFANVIGDVYGCGWRNISPNLSVQWYFHMQLFSRFRDYFGALLLGLPYVVLAPISIRLYKYPMELVAILSLVWTIFRPVETLFDMNITFCFLLFCPKSLARMETISFIALCSMWVPVILYVVDYWMWLEPGTGNANYMFFQCLAYNVFLGIILGQFCSACVQRDKALRLVRKETMQPTGDH